MDFETLLPWPVHGWVLTLTAVALVVLAMLGIHRVGAARLARSAESRTLAPIAVRRSRVPAALVLVLAGSQLALRTAPPTLPDLGLVEHVNWLFLIAAVAWLGTRLMRAVGDVVVSGNAQAIEENFTARRIRTQASVLVRSGQTLVLLVAAACMLMTFPEVRQIGASLLASAGVAGLIVGIAARPVLGNLLAGLQIALSQPLRLGDVVIVQGEWGRVEEITGAYVVLTLWDERSLVVPLTWFIENPFQNWTRSSARILGTVFLWVDFAMPIPPLRAEAQRLCAEAPDWDGRFVSLQVTETSERSMQVRVLVSAQNSARCWDLRCQVREGLLAFMVRHYPHYLPRLRTHLSALGEEDTETDPRAGTRGPGSMRPKPRAAPQSRS